ncbi:hypothetical protein [Pseudozobellia thermophila]|nr:hypothetical protein [Pseudozobellia thermophila]
MIENKRFDMTDLMVTIDFEPKNDPLRYFLSSIGVFNYPKFLDSFSSSKSYYTHVSSLRFYKDLDWEDLEELSEVGGIKEGEITISHEVYGETVLKEAVFKELILDYSQALLETYKNDSSAPKLWSNEMTDEITKLKNKPS